MISRYFDFNHPSGAAYGWKGESRKETSSTKSIPN